MDPLNATAGLSLAIETGTADRDLEKLEAQLARLANAGVGGVAAGSDDAAREIKMLKAEVEALSTQIDQGRKVRESMSRVTRSWSAAEGAARVAFRENANLTGEQVKNLAKDADRLKQSLKEIKLDNLGLDPLGNARIQLVGRIRDTFKAVQASAQTEGKKSADTVRAQVSSIQDAFETLSSKSRVNSNRMKSILEGMFSAPAGKPGQETVAEMSAAYRQLEQAGNIYQQAKQRNADLAASFGQLRAQAVQSITETNSVLQAMGLRYKAMEQQDADKRDTRARADLVARNNRLIEQEEKSHLSTIAAMRAQSSRALAEQASADLTLQKAAAAQQAEMLGNMERMRASWQNLGKAQSSATLVNQARELKALNLEMARAYEAAKNSPVAESLPAMGRKVLATKAIVEQFGEAQARAFLGRNDYLVDQIHKLDQMQKEAQEASAALATLRQQAASVSYASASPVQRANLNLRAGIALDRGYDTSGYAQEALLAARAAGSVGALEEAKRKLQGQTASLTGANHALNATMMELHTGARGLAGSFGALWMTYGSLLPLLTGAALGSAFKNAFTKGAEFEYQLTFVKALGGESAEAVERLGAAAIALGKDGLYGPIKIAEGFRILAQAGLNAKEQLAAIPQVLDLATTGELGVEAAAETLVGVATAFGKSKLELQVVGDVIAKAAAVSQTSVSAMTESMKYASVVGEQYKVSLEDTSTALAVLAKLNITGTSAGTSFRNMVKELYTPTAEAAKAFKLLGVETKDSIGNLRPMVDIIYDIKDKLEEYDSASQTNILQKMFGERGAKEAIAMLSMTREEWNKLKNDIADSEGFMGKVAAELEATTSGTLKQAFNTLEASLIEVFNSSKYGMGELASTLKSLFGSEEFKQLLGSFVTLMAGAAQAVVKFSDELLLLGGGYAFIKITAGLNALIPALAGVAATSATAAGAAGLGGVAGMLPTLAARLAPLAGPAGLVVGLGLSFVALWANMKSGESAAEQVIGSTGRIVEAMTRQTQKILDGNDALRERIRLAKGLPVGDGPNSPLNTARAGVKSIQDEIGMYQALLKNDGNGLWKERIETLNKSLAVAQANVRAAEAEAARGTAAEKVRDGLKVEAEAAERVKAQSQQVKKLSEELAKSKRSDSAELIRSLASTTVPDRLDEVIKDVQDKLDKGKKKADNSTWAEMGGGRGRPKSGNTRTPGQQDLIAASQQRMNTLFQEYQDFERKQKGLVDSFQMSFEDAYLLDLEKLRANRALAQTEIEKAVIARGGSKEALEKSNAEQLELERKYNEASAALDRDLEAQRASFYASAEKAAIDSGQKVLSTEELYQREWHSKWGETLKKALLMSTNKDPEIAAAGKRIADELTRGFGAGLNSAEVDAKLKTLGQKIQAFQAQMSEIMKRDKDGGLLTAIFGGTAAELEALKVNTVKALNESLDEVQRQIAEWNGSEDSDKRLQLIAKRDQIVAQIEEAKQVVSPSIAEFADTMGMGMANSIIHGFDASQNAGMNFVKDIGDAMKKSITKALADSLSKEITLQMTAAASGSGDGSGQSGGFSLGNLMNLGSTASKVANFFGGTEGWSSAYQGAAGFTQFGTMASSFGSGFSAAAGGASLTEAVAAYNAAGMTSTAASLEAGASLASSLGGAAGTISSVMSTLAAAAPYLAAAVLIAQYLGAFDGPTYHKGGASIVDSAGNTTQATSSNISDWNLQWGAYNSDRVKGYDDATAAISAGLVNQIKANVEAFGGDATKFSVASRFTSDNDDWSEGSYRLLDENMKTVFEFTKRYTEDANKAIEEFGADGTRALVGALQNANLDQHFKAVLGNVDPMTASMEELQAALKSANTMAVIMNSGADALEAAADAGMSASSKFLEMGDTIREMADSGAYSMDQMASALETRYNLELELIQSINEASKSIGESFQESIRSINYSVLDDQGKYAMLDSESAGYIDMIKSLTDVTEIEKYAAKLNDAINTAFSLVDEDQQKEKSQEFVDRLLEADKVVQDRLAAVKEQTVNDQTTLAKAIADQMMTNFQVMQTGLEQAAKSIPERVFVDVDVNVIGNGDVSTEVGYMSPAG